MENIYGVIADATVALLIDQLITTQKTLVSRIEQLENDLNTVWPDRAWNNRYECNSCTHQCEEY